MGESRRLGSGNRHSKKSSSNGLAAASSSKPSHALHGCYFVLGMGLNVACNSIWQCMDYMNTAYKGSHPSQTMSTLYNTLYTVGVFTLFFGGPRLWPNKQRRMLTGYCMYVLALALPPLIDTLVWRTRPQGSNLQDVMSVWAFGTAIAGSADAIISSVIYVQAASLGLAYTHAFLAGKAACGLTMAALRCVSKAALPGRDLQTLQLATAIFLAAGAAIVAACVVIVAVVLPRLQAGKQLTETTSLTVQQTLAASFKMSQTAPMFGQAPSRHHPHLLQHSNTLSSMMPGMGSTAQLCPAFAASFGSTTPEADAEIDVEDPSTAAAAAAAPHARLFGLTLTRMDSRVSWATGTDNSFRILSLDRHSASGWSEGSFRVSLRAPTLSSRRTAANTGSADWRSSSGKSWWSQSPQHIADADATVSALPVSTRQYNADKADVPSGDTAGACDQSSSTDAHTASGWLSKTASSFKGFKSPSWFRRSLKSQATDVLSSCSWSDGSEPDTAASTAAAAAADIDAATAGQHSAVSADAHAHAARDAPKHDSATAAAAGTADAVHPPSSWQQSAASEGQTELPLRMRMQHTTVQHSRSAERSGSFGESPFLAAVQSSQLPTVEEKGSVHFPADLHINEPPTEPTLLESIHAVWLTMKVIYPYQAAAFIPPLVTAAILPMIFGMDFSKSALGSWYVQVTAVTYQLGMFIGSGLIPVPTSLERPKATLLTAALGMLSFVVAFACALKLNGGPFAMIVLAFFMYMYSGYLTSCTFCLAGKGLLPDDSQLVQMVLVLTTGVSFVLGSCISWAWVAVPKSS